MAIIFYASSQPYQEQDLKPFLSEYIDLSFLAPYLDWIVFTYHTSEVSVKELGVEGFIEFFIRKGAHFGVFLVLFLLLYFAITRTTEISLKQKLAISLLISVLYGIFDEVHQGFTPNRTPFFGDVVIDSVGAVTGLLLIFFYYKTRKKRDTLS